MNEEQGPRGSGDLLSVRDAAARMGLSEQFVYSHIASGDLVAIRLGRAIRIDPRDLEKFIERGRSARRI